MKKLILTAVLFACFVATSQTAVNFNTNDCAGNNHDLFAELDAGKVVVITWVMPCSSCIGGATAARNAVNSFSASNPGQVVHYVADDYANSSCVLVNNWLTSYSIAPNAVFSSTAVSMSGYGAAGMPKVIVLGGNSHTVYYNVNGSGNINTPAIQSAITNAFGAVGITSTSTNSKGSSVSPNPAAEELTVNLSSKGKSIIEISSMSGQLIEQLESVNQENLKINTSNFAPGIYLLKITGEQTTDIHRLIISAQK